MQSVVGNAGLILRKIYFPREVFPITSILTKVVELAISMLILAGLMAWYGMMPTVHVIWVPLIILYTILVSLTIAFAGAAVNVYYRDVGTALPVLLSLLMYASPVIYPLELVKSRLLVERAAGEWSNLLYTVYTLNPLAGIIESFQNVVLLAALPRTSTHCSPAQFSLRLMLPFSYLFFKRAEYTSPT